MAVAVAIANAPQTKFFFILSFPSLE